MNWMARSRLLGLTAGSAFVLVSCPPHLSELINGLRSPWLWVADVGPDAATSAVAGALLWLVALWVALGLAVTAVSFLPGRLGRLGHATAGRLTPAALRRVVAAATSTSILLGPATALASPAGGGTPAPAGAAAVLPAIGWPTDPGPAASPARPHPPAGSVTDTERVTAARSVGVRAGDSLWSIAGRRLGAGASAARIQQEWPRWYAANRQLIGGNPNLIRPGIILRAPAADLLAPGTAPMGTDR